MDEPVQASTTLSIDASAFPLSASIYGEFPVRDDISSGESGHGYVLRMAVANFLNGLPAVKRMLGKTRFAVLDSGDAPMLSQWFGAEVDTGTRSNRHRALRERI
jgi:hypothetical protein